MTGLTWGIKRSFVDYVAASSGVVTATGVSTSPDGYTFPRSEATPTELRFTGVVEFAAHGGMLAITVANPAIERHEDKTELTIDDPNVPGGRLAFATLDPGAPDDAGLVTARAVLTREGSRLFDGYYPTGIELDDVRYPGAGSSPRRGSVAIIGSGPSGCYTAQAIIKSHPDAEVVVFERLPVPYGLVRYGIATDHQGTKAVAKQFDRVFERGGVRFVGNVTVGDDISLDKIRQAFDVVVIATGMHADRSLDVPGAHLPGVFGSGSLTRHLNGHPEAALQEFPLGTDVVVVGAGNVAIDLVRLLAKHLDDFQGSDIHPHAESTTLTAGIERITVLSRSTMNAARCDAAMVKELGRIPGVRYILDSTVDADSPVGQAFAGLTAEPSPDARVEVEFVFESRPLEILGEAGVTAVKAETSAGAERVIRATSVLTAIGYTDNPAAPALESDDAGVLRVGWANFGPRGALPEARLDGKRAAEDIAARWDALEGTPDRPGFLGVQAQLSHSTDFTTWRRIDAAETTAAPPHRVRRKILSVAEMLDLQTPHPTEKES